MGVGEKEDCLVSRETLALSFEAKVEQEKSIMLEKWVCERRNWNAAFLQAYQRIGPST